MLIRAVIDFIFSNGDDGKIKKVRSSIRYMVTGLVVALIVLFVMPVLLNRLGFPGEDYFTARNVFLRAGEVLGNLFGITVDTVSEMRATSGIAPADVSTYNPTPYQPLYPNQTLDPYNPPTAQQAADYTNTHSNTDNYSNMDNYSSSTPATYPDNP